MHKLCINYAWLSKTCMKHAYLCLGAHAQARYTVVCLCVCLCVGVSVCVDCYSCSRINEVQVYRLLVMFSWILIRGFAK